MNRKKKMVWIAAAVTLGAVFADMSQALPEGNSEVPTADEMRLFTDVVDKVKREYVEPVDDAKLMTGALKGMAASLDAHSWYLDKTDYKKFQENTSGVFAGLGMEVSLEDGLVKVASPIEGTPAFRAGVLSGDMITRINDNPVRGMTLDEAVAQMRGDAGTEVTLRIFRKSEDRTFALRLTRAIIKVQSVRMKVLAPDYAYIRITTFQERTTPDLAARLQDLARMQPELKGLVLDLRNNGGGLIQGAVGVASAFLQPGSVVVSTRGQIPESKQILRDTYGDYRLPSFDGDPLKDEAAIFRTVPMIVLTNAYSASASEIVAGALQDQHRALIAGKTTYGKGSVQTVRSETAGTALSITTAYYYTPAGRSIQNRGIRPDVFIDQYADGDPDEALVTREIDSDNHLANRQDPDDRIEQEQHERDRLAQLRLLEERNARQTPEQSRKERQRRSVEFGSADDFMLQQALKRLERKQARASASEMTSPAAVMQLPANARLSD